MKNVISLTFYNSPDSNSPIVEFQLNNTANLAAVLS